jgi:predicted nucleotidyltransferase
MRSNLDIAFELDRRWRLLRGEMDGSKKTALIELARILDEARVPYAVIGGVAVQIHQVEPRTTIDIDLAVLARAQIPRERLSLAGFRRTGSFTNSENWIGPEETPVQFTDDATLAPAIERAEEIIVESVKLRVIAKRDLLREKLRAGSDPARRRSKRLQDLADAQSLVEADSSLLEALTEAERRILEHIP